MNTRKTWTRSWQGRNLQESNQSAVSALTKQLQPVDFRVGTRCSPRARPGDRLYIIISGKVKIGRRSPDSRENLLTIAGSVGHVR